MADYEEPKDKDGGTLQAKNPKDNATPASYLFGLLNDATKAITDRERNNCLLNILAARAVLRPDPTKKDTLEYGTLWPREVLTNAQQQIPVKHKELQDSSLMNRYFSARKPEKLLSLISADVKGEKLENDLLRFTQNIAGPLPGDTPQRYMPTALQRIEVLKKRLGKLPKTDPNYAERAREICAEIAATRSAVNSTPGDKSTLKHKYDPKLMRRHYQAIYQALGSVEIDSLVTDALKFGHGGKMEPRVREAVRQYAEQSNTLMQDTPARYQITYHERLTFLHRNLKAQMAELKKRGVMNSELRERFRKDMAELFTLRDQFDSQVRKAEKGGVRLTQEQKNALRIDNTRVKLENGINGAVQQLTEHPAINSLMDKLACGEVVLDALDKGLKSDDYMPALTGIIRDEFLDCGARAKPPQEQEAARQEKYAKSDREVEKKQLSGTEILNQMRKQKLPEIRAALKANSKKEDGRYETLPGNMPDYMRAIRLYCDKEEAVQRAYQKSLDPNTQVLDEGKFAKELSGERFQDTLRQVQRDPVYRRMMSKKSPDELKTLVWHPDKLHAQYETVRKAVEQEEAVQKQQVVNAQVVPEKPKEEIVTQNLAPS